MVATSFVEDEEPDITAWAKARLGTTIAGKWSIDSLLGIGGTAAVFAATHRTGHRVAIKVLHPMLADNATARSRLLREAYAANQLAEHGAVAVLDDGVDGNATYLVMDLLDGETLAARASRFGGTLPVDEVLDCANDVLVTLTEAHKRGIVHRDLKPQNILRQRDGRVRVLDFGLARVTPTMTLPDVGTASRSTLGTPAFMAPEQARGHGDRIGPHTDVWGVAATIVRLLTGRYVHDAHTAGEMLIAVGTQPVKPIALLVPRLTPDVAAVFDRALAFDVHDRWVDAGAMRAALQGARSGSAFAASHPTPKREALVDTLPEDVPPNVQASTMPALATERRYPMSTRRKALVALVLAPATFFALRGIPVRRDDTPKTESQRLDAPPALASPVATERVTHANTEAIPAQSATPAEPSASKRQPRVPVAKPKASVAPVNEAPIAPSTSPTPSATSRTTLPTTDELLDQRR